MAGEDGGLWTPDGGVRPKESNVTSLLDVYDHEIKEIEAVIEVLSRKSGDYTVLEGFRQEIIDRFFSIGFKVNVKVWNTNVAEAYIFEIEIYDRTDKHEFDFDRQVHEVVNDELELGEGGWIKSSEEVKKMADQPPHAHKH